MTKTLTLRSLDIPAFTKFGIGFDSMFDELNRASLQTTSSYPPYNVIKYDDDHYTIELAVAGFKEGEITLTLEKNKLVITGQQAEKEIDGEFVVHGISSRPFDRSFTLAEHVRVTAADVADGMLRIALERIVPEEQKPRTLAINYNK